MKELLILLDPIESAKMVIRIDMILKQKEDNQVVIAYQEYLTNGVVLSSRDLIYEKSDKALAHEDDYAVDESASDEE